MQNEIYETLTKCSFENIQKYDFNIFKEFKYIYLAKEPFMGLIGIFDLITKKSIGSYETEREAIKALEDYCFNSKLYLTTNIPISFKNVARIYQVQDEVVAQTISLGVENV